MEYLKSNSFIDELKHQLRLDVWHVDDALRILCCVDPKSAEGAFRPLGIPEERTIDSVEVPFEADPPRGMYEFDRSEANHNYVQLWDIWRSGVHARIHDDEVYFSPSYFIEWATNKGIQIPWLETAKSIGLACPSVPTTNEISYSTPLLDILTSATAEFFEPRRNPDAKKEEVVEWIKARMKEATILDSDNIATAIFTIIKPINHDPRKRRG